MKEYHIRLNFALSLKDYQLVSKLLLVLSSLIFMVNPHIEFNPIWLCPRCNTLEIFCILKQVIEQLNFQLSRKERNKLKHAYNGNLVDPTGMDIIDFLDSWDGKKIFYSLGTDLLSILQGFKSVPQDFITYAKTSEERDGIKGYLYKLNLIKYNKVTSNKKPSTAGHIIDDKSKTELIRAKTEAQTQVFQPFENYGKIIEEMRKEISKLAEENARMVKLIESKSRPEEAKKSDYEELVKAVKMTHLQQAELISSNILIMNALAKDPKKPLPALNKTNFDLIRQHLSTYPRINDESWYECVSELYEQKLAEHKMKINDHLESRLKDIQLKLTETIHVEIRNLMSGYHLDLQQIKSCQNNFMTRSDIEKEMNEMMSRKSSNELLSLKIEQSEKIEQSSIAPVDQNTTYTVSDEPSNQTNVESVLIMPVIETTSENNQVLSEPDDSLSSSIKINDSLEEARTADATRISVNGPSVKETGSPLIGEENKKDESLTDKGKAEIEKMTVTSGFRIPFKDEAKIFTLATEELMLSGVYCRVEGKSKNIQLGDMTKKALLYYKTVDDISPVMRRVNDYKAKAFTPVNDTDRIAVLLVKIGWNGENLTLVIVGNGYKIRWNIRRKGV